MDTLRMLAVLGELETAKAAFEAEVARILNGDDGAQAPVAPSHPKRGPYKKKATAAQMAAVRKALAARWAGHKRKKVSVRAGRRYGVTTAVTDLLTKEAGALTARQVNERLPGLKGVSGVLARLAHTGRIKRTKGSHTHDGRYEMVR